MGDESTARALQREQERRKSNKSNDCTFKLSFMAAASGVFSDSASAAIRRQIETSSGSMKPAEQAMRTKVERKQIRIR
jgi:hypothetical protein